MMEERDRKSSSRSIDPWVALVVVAGPPLHTFTSADSLLQVQATPDQKRVEQEDTQIRIIKNRLIQRI